MKAKLYYRWAVIWGIMAVSCGAYLAIKPGDAGSWEIDQWAVFIVGVVCVIPAWACMIKGRILERRDKPHDP
jgi:hypothetical protein